MPESRCDACVRGDCSKCVQGGGKLGAMLSQMIGAPSPWTVRDSTCPCFEASPDLHRTLATTGRG